MYIKKDARHERTGALLQVCLLFVVGIRSLYERSVLQIAQAYLHTLLHRHGVLLYLSYDCLHSGNIRVAEYGVIPTMPL